MRRLGIAVVLVVAAAVPAAAYAGGWATVVLAPPPAGLEADEAWTANITVLRHGRTPTDGAAPWLTIRADGWTRAFAAKPAGKTGAYVAKVVFPSAGAWSYEVSDGLAATGYGMSQTHTYAPIQVVGGTGGGGLGLPVWPFAIAAIGLVAAGAFALSRERGRRPAPQS